MIIHTREEDRMFTRAKTEPVPVVGAEAPEFNLAAGSVVAIGIAEPTGALNFARASGLKSYVLYDYARVTSRQWGLWKKDHREGDYARRAVFVVGPDRKVAHAWVGERPEPGEILAKVSEITGLPKPPEEPKEDGKEGESEEGGEKPKRMSAEEREKIKAERRAAREAGKSVKTGTSAESKAPPEAGSEGEGKKEGEGAFGGGGGKKGRRGGP